MPLDKNFKLPILYSDSITVEQISKGFFPVKNENIDTLISNLIYLKEMLSKRQRSKMQSFELHSSNSIIKTKRIPFAYGDRYSSIAEAYYGNLTAKLTLIDSREKNSKNADHISKILAYLKSNKSFYKEPYEVTPKLYNVIVITE